MKTTREEILAVSLKLFAEKGFDAVSTSMIAERLGITKGALYRHFASKQGIFDAIWDRMVELDAHRANEDCVPEKSYAEDGESYRNTDAHDLCRFVENQFVFWTEDPFARDFRRMITLEQFKSKEMSELFQNVICAGPVRYTEDLMSEMLRAGKLNDRAKEMGAANLAAMMFAPLFLMIQMADGGADPKVLKGQLSAIMKDFEERWVC